MNEDIRRYGLGAEGVGFVRKELLTYSTLGRLLAARLQLDAGAAFTEFPADVNEGSLREFQWGGKLPSPPPETHFRGSDGSRIIPVPSMKHLAVQRISGDLLDQPGSICLLYDLMARWEDPYMKRLVEESWILRVGAEIYHALTHESALRGDVERIFRQAHGFVGFLGVLSEATPAAGLPTSGGLLGEAELEEVCRGAYLVFVGAYDGEGLVYWERAESIGSSSS